MSLVSSFFLEHGVYMHFYPAVRSNFVDSTGVCTGVVLMTDGVCTGIVIMIDVCTGVVLMTDGVVGFPDTSLLQLLLHQFHRDCVSCSFIQLDGTHHMQQSFGFVSHPRLLQFIALSTGGTYFSAKPRLVGLILCKYNCTATTGPPTYSVGGPD